MAAGAARHAGLVDPDPPEPTRLYPTFDDEVAFEAAAALRQAVCLDAGNPRPLHRRARRVRPAPVFSPGVRWAAYEALHEARRCGIRHARPEHLVLGLLALPGGAARQLLARWSVIEAERLTRQIRAHPAYRTNGEPSQWGVVMLTAVRALRPDRDPAIWRWPWRLTLMLLLSVLFFPHYRRHGARYGHPLLFLVEVNAADKAAYTGHGHVTAAHVLLTVLDLHQQLTSADKTLPTFLARWNVAGAILARHGIDRQAATRAAARLARDPADN